MGNREFEDVRELLNALSPYISARALARIVGMSESQMLQYKAGIKKRINEKLRTFASELQEFTLKGA